jgi:tetratricopeptide (TPR) repeat protein
LTPGCDRKPRRRTSTFVPALVALQLAVGSLSQAAEPLGAVYVRAIRRADSLYLAGRYSQALPAYAVARALLPSELGPQVGIGWCDLQLGRFPEAESAFRRILETDPEQAQARRGLRLTPGSYRCRLTLSGIRTLPADAFTQLGGLAEFRLRDRTRLTVGVQMTAADSWQGVNTSGILYQPLDYRTSLRFDFYTLGAFSDWRYWHVVWAPSLMRDLGRTWRLRFTLIGWDNLQTFGAQCQLSRDLTPRLMLQAAPAVNSSRPLDTTAKRQLGFLVPLELRYRFLPWLQGRAYAGAGVIARHADLDVPILYNQLQPLLATVRAGVDIEPGRWRILPFVAWERYAAPAPGALRAGPPATRDRWFASLSVGVGL